MFIQRTVLDQTSIPVAAKALDAYMLRNRANSNNIANVTTPNYNRIEVSFEDQLKEALDKKRIQGDRSDENHMFLGRPDLVQVRAEGYRVDDPTMPGEINNVDIDVEMAKMAENQIQFNFGVKFIQSRMEDITAAIKQSGLGG